MRVGDPHSLRGQSEAILFGLDTALGIVQEGDGGTTMSSIHCRAWIGWEHRDSPSGKRTHLSSSPQRERLGRSNGLSGTGDRRAQKPKSGPFLSHQTGLGRRPSPRAAVSRIRFRGRLGNAEWKAMGSKQGHPLYPRQVPPAMFLSIKIVDENFLVCFLSMGIIFGASKNCEPSPPFPTSTD